MDAARCVDRGLRTSWGLGIDLVEVLEVSLELVVIVGEDEELGKLGGAHGADDGPAVEQLAHLARCRRHELNLGQSAVLPGAADERPCQPGSCHADGAADHGENAQRHHGEDQVIEPRQALAGKLGRELLSEQGKDANVRVSARASPIVMTRGAI